jgi:hypothetical protein
VGDKEDAFTFRSVSDKQPAILKLITNHSFVNKRHKKRLTAELPSSVNQTSKGYLLLYKSNQIPLISLTQKGNIDNYTDNANDDNDYI